MLIKRLAAPAIIILIIGIIYAKAVDNPLFFDSGGLSFPGGFKILDFLRWVWVLVTSLSVKINRSITMESMNLALDLQEQNIFSIVLHTVNSILLFVLLQGMYRFRTAAIVALFFAVNPAAIYAVCYLINRSQLFMVFFGLLQCIFYSRALIGNRWLSPVFFVLSLMCFKCAILSKEHAVVLLAAYPILTVAIRQNLIRSLAYCSVIAVLCWVMASDALHMAMHVGREYYSVGLVERTCTAMKDVSSLYFRSVLTQAGLFFRYFLNWILPLPTSIDMRFPFVESNFDFRGMIAYVGFAIASIGFLLWRPTRHLGCGLLMAVCLFLPEFSSVRAGEIFVMYRSYLYSIGYMIAIAWFVDLLSPHRLIAVVLLLALAGVTSERLKDFDSELSLWTHAAKMIDLSDPAIACQGARAFNNAGGQYMKAGKYWEAINYFKTASMIDPEWNLPFSNLGVAYLFTGQLKQAEIVFSDLDKRSGVPEDMAEQARGFLQQIRRL